MSVTPHSIHESNLPVPGKLSGLELFGENHVDPQDTVGTAQEGTARANFSDAAILGKRVSFFRLLMVSLFILLMIAGLFSGDSGFVGIWFIVMLGFLFFIQIRLFIRPPKLSVEDGMFSVRLLPEYTTQASNVADLLLEGKKLRIVFHEVTDVTPQHGQSSLVKQSIPWI